MRPVTCVAMLGLVLTINGCARGASLSAAPAPALAGPVLPAGVTVALIARGDSLFNTGACIRCHGPKGVGGENAPSLVAGPWLHHRGSYDEIIATVTAGVPRAELKDATRRFAMNPRGGPMKLSDDQVREVAAYVWSISREKR
ncbi:MAG: c-type cytochrome [Gemmatimonadota bacterium]